MSDANAQTSHHAGLSRGVVALVAGLALAGAGMLWVRFGESVYAQSIVSAIIACF